MFWVKGSKQVLENLRRNYRRYTTQPYEQVFVEITGEIAGKASGGFAVDYDGRFLAKKMLKMTKKSNDECIQFHTRAALRDYWKIMLFGLGCEPDFNTGKPGWHENRRVCR